MAKNKIRIIACGHAGIGHDDYKTIKAGPDIFVSLTEEALNWATKIAPANTKTVLIPVGLDTVRFATASKEKLFTNEFPVVYCNAALVPYKRVDLVVRAVAMLQNVNLVLTGGGPLLKEIAALGEDLLGSQKFKCLGSINYDKIPSFYASCDVCTLASQPVENSPVVFMEAMAAGKPVVATDFERARWILDGAGIFVDPVNLPEFSAALSEALFNKETRARLVLACTKRVKYFDWRSVAQEYFKLCAEYSE